uniref:NADH dehydrogenase subunit 4L n=1 Tax=Taenia solium TaxID=6204 RepID=Q8M6L2_TAESO|nr:NADH dehydrogenase subunit 4L [Taenia solium]BAC00836.1 NADH dehydrogenase subunit 4L [Taenia solium]
MTSLFLILCFVISVSFFLSITRFLNSLIVLENFNVLILMFCLIFSSLDSHMIFMALMIISTVEIIVGLVILTRVWECSFSLDLIDF